MIIPFHATLPVSGDQAINALADRHFISGCVDGIQLEHSVGDDLLRGTFTVGESDTTYQFGLRLVDFDADDHSLSYEASAREVDGRGLASLVIYLDIDDATSALVVTSRLEMAGMGAGAAYSNLEQAVADRLVAFATSVVAALGDDAGRLWRTPGASADQDPETPLTTAIPAKAALGPRLQRVLLPLGALGGTGVVAYLIWRVVRNDQAKGATS